MQATPGNLLSSWTLDLPLVLLLAAAAALYLRGAARLRARSTAPAPDATARRRAWPVLRTACFLCGLAVVAIALMSGIDADSERLLSVHMVQHLLLSLLAPTLLLCAAPVRLALASGSHGLRATLAAWLSTRFVRTLAHPAVGLALFALVQLATHLTGIFELALEDPWMHALEHGAYFWSGVLLLAPLIAADPLPHAPAPLARFGWTMGAMTAMAIPGALLAFEPTVRYRFYLVPARALGRSAIEDQHVAGAIMWVGSGVAMFSLALSVTMAAMLAEERRQRRRELYVDGGAAGTEREAGALRA
jgi:cytochrome c oxidase assembly factor CtaG